MRRLKYTHQICNAILADGFARVVDIDSNAEILQFTGKPIHYSFFMEIWDKRKDKGINLKGMGLSTKKDLILKIFKENPEANQTEVAKMLGVEIGEVFKIDSKPHCLFRFTHKCLQVSVTPDFWLMGSDDYLRGFLNGSLSIHKLFWKPKKREIYYCPNIFGIDLYNVSVWDDSIVDKEFYIRGLVFKTKEEAIAMSRRMLAIAIKEEREND